MKNDIKLFSTNKKNYSMQIDFWSNAINYLLELNLIFFNPINKKSKKIQCTNKTDFHEFEATIEMFCTQAVNQSFKL